LQISTFYILSYKIRSCLFQPNIKPISRRNGKGKKGMGITNIEQGVGITNIEQGTRKSKFDD